MIRAALIFSGDAAPHCFSRERDAADATSFASLLGIKEAGHPSRSLAKASVDAKADRRRDENQPAPTADASPRASWSASAIQDKRPRHDDAEPNIDRSAAGERNRPRGASRAKAAKLRGPARGIATRRNSTEAVTPAVAAALPFAKALPVSGEEAAPSHLTALPVDASRQAPASASSPALTAPRAWGGRDSVTVGQQLSALPRSTEQPAGPSPVLTAAPFAEPVINKPQSGTAAPESKAGHGQAAFAGTRPTGLQARADRSIPMIEAGVPAPRALPEDIPAGAAADPTTHAPTRAGGGRAASAPPSHSAPMIGARVPVPAGIDRLPSTVFAQPLPANPLDATIAVPAKEANVGDEQGRHGNGTAPGKQTPAGLATAAAVRPSTKTAAPVRPAPIGAAADAGSGRSRPSVMPTAAAPSEASQPAPARSELTAAFDLLAAAGSLRDGVNAASATTVAAADDIDQTPRTTHPVVSPQPAGPQRVRGGALPPSTPAATGAAPAMIASAILPRTIGSDPVASDDGPVPPGPAPSPSSASAPPVAHFARRAVSDARVASEVAATPEPKAASDERKIAPPSADVPRQRRSQVTPSSAQGAAFALVENSTAIAGVADAMPVSPPDEIAVEASHQAQLPSQPRAAPRSGSVRVPAAIEPPGKRDLPSVDPGPSPTIAGGPSQSALATDKARPTMPSTAPAADAVSRQLDLAQGTAWLDRLASDIATTAAGTAPLRFALSPERLGRLTVELTNVADGAAVRLTTETAEAHRILTTAQPHLVAEARAQGLRIADTRVEHEPPRQDSGSMAGQGGDPQQRRPVAPNPAVAPRAPARLTASPRAASSRRAASDLYA